MKKKNIITACLVVLAMTLVFSCSNDEGAEFMNHQTKSVEVNNLSSKIVDKSEIPEGATIITVKDDNELKDVVKSMSKMKVKFVFDCNKENKEPQSQGSLFTGLEKMADPEAGGGTSGWYVLIKVDLIYYGPKDPIDVVSSASIVGQSNHMVKSCTQTYSTAKWTNSFTAIDYYVEGNVVLVCYAYNKEKKRYEYIECEPTPFEKSGTKYI